MIITTTGFGIRAITDAGLDYISDQFLPYLSDGEYLDAFETYADLCDEFLTQAKTGNAYDGDHMPKGAYPWLKNLLIALGSGVVIALLIVEGMRRSLKSVKMQRSAEKYAGDKTAGSFPVYQNKQKCEAEEQFRIFRIKYAYVIFRNKPWWRWWKILREKYEENSNYRR